MWETRVTDARFQASSTHDRIWAGWPFLFLLSAFSIAYHVSSTYVEDTKGEGHTGITFKGVLKSWGEVVYVVEHVKGYLIENNYVKYRYEG